jgi:putative ABC transport system permease protein
MLPVIRFANWLWQVAVLTRLGAATLNERKGSTLAAMFGIAGVVVVFVATLSIAEGFRRAMTGAGDASLALVLRSGSDTEMMSFLGGAETRIIADAPGIALSEYGPMVSRELFAVLALPKRNTGTDANVPLRGVEPGAFRVHDRVRLVAGRSFEPGRNEVIVGVGAAQEFAGLDLGAKLLVGRITWDIVGLFTAEGGLAESELWTDSSILRSAYQRGNSFQGAVVRLTSPESFEEFSDALMRDPRLNVKVLRQTDYFADQSRTVHNLITGLGTLIASLMALGAVFGALNTMYSTVAARTRELATLRALGFGGGAVVLSVMAESLTLALLGGATGAAVAWVGFDGFRAATMNWQSFSQVAFVFTVTPQLLAQGIGYAMAIGAVGGLFPALRAARLPVAQALREM